MRRSAVSHSKTMSTATNVGHRKSSLYLLFACDSLPSTYPAKALLQALEDKGLQNTGRVEVSARWDITVISRDISIHHLHIDGGEYKVCGWVPLIFLQSKHSLCRILKTFSSEGGGIVLPYFYAAAERETKRDVYNFGSVRGMSGRIREIYQEETGKDIIEEFPVSLLCVTKSEEDTHREGEALARELRCRFDQISLDCLEGMNAYMNSITRKNQWWRVRDRRCGEGLTLLEWEQRYWPRVRCVLERDMPQCHMLYGSITQAMGGDSMYTLLEPPMPSQNLENSVTSEGTWAGYCGVM
ncbi:hypothetical protein AAMO2058_000782500 [Amorphochlora amoebiformis]